MGIGKFWSRQVNRWAMWCVGLFISTVAVGGATQALWRDVEEPGTVRIGIGQVGLTVERLDGPPVAHVLTDVAQPVAVNLTEADLVEVAANSDGIAIPLQVRVRSDGHTAANFWFKVPAGDGSSKAAGDPNGLLSGANIKVFAVKQPSECAAGADGTPAPTPVNGTPADYAPTKLDQSYWCLTVKYDHSKVGQYKNTGSVTATGPNGEQATDSATWEAKLMPDPVAEAAQLTNPDNTLRVGLVLSRP